MKKTIPRMLLILVFTGMLVLAFCIKQIESPTPPETEWTQTYGGAGSEEAYSVIQTSDGGYAIAGGTTSTSDGRWDFLLVKTDANGNEQWNKTYGGIGSDEMLRSMIQTADGGYALAGAFDDPHYADVDDFLLVKTDAAGNMEWNQTYGGANWDFAWSVIQTRDGGYAIVGNTGSFGAGGWDIWLVKTDPNGNMEWSQTYGGPNDDLGIDLIQTGDMGYALAAHTNSFGAGSSDFWLVKTYPNGTMQWNKTYGGSRSDGAYSIVQANDGGYVLSGGLHSFGVGSELNAWLVKTDSDGNMEWNNMYGGSGNDQVLSMVKTNDGGYALAGEALSFGAGSDDFWLVRTDSNGIMEWNQTYGGTDVDEAWCVIQTGDGGYALAGPTNSFGAGSTDFWLAKIAPEEISAEINIDPDTLNLKSNGEWVTGYITLPEGFLVENIDIATVELMHNDVVVKTADWGEIQDNVLMVKFDRATLRDYLGEVDVDDGDKFYDITLTVTGSVTGTPFEGSDTITVKRK